MAGPFFPVGAQTQKATNRIPVAALGNARAIPLKVAAPDSELEKTTRVLEEALKQRNAKAPDGGWTKPRELASTVILRRWAVVGPEATPEKVHAAERRMHALAYQIRARAALHDGDLLGALSEADTWVKWAEGEDKGEAELIAVKAAELPQQLWAGTPEELALFGRLHAREPKPGDEATLKEWDEEDRNTFWARVDVMLGHWAAKRPEGGARFRELLGYVQANREATDFLKKLEAEFTPRTVQELLQGKTKEPKSGVEPVSRPAQVEREIGLVQAEISARQAELEANRASPFYSAGLKRRLESAIKDALGELQSRRQTLEAERARIKAGTGKLK